MTYNLEEFKEWLKASENNRRNYTWENWLHNLDYIIQKGQEYFDYFVEGKDYGEDVVFHFATNSGWKPYVEVVQKWKAEVDQERERERERANRGGKK